jgi:hypothetical protein
VPPEQLIAELNRRKEEAMSTQVSSQLDVAPPRQLLIDGRWVPARSGRTFHSINPSIGGVELPVDAGCLVK